MPNSPLNITKSTLGTVLSQIPSHLFGILAGIFIARTLGPEGRGLYAIFFANMTLYCTLFGGSITTSIIYFITTKKMSVGKINTLSVFTLMMTMILSSCAITLSLIPSIQKWVIPDYNWNTADALIMLQIIFLTQLNTALTAYFQGKQNFKLVNLVLVLNSIYSLIGFGVLYIISLKGTIIDISHVLTMYRFILILNTIHWLYNFLRKETIQFDFRISIQEIKQFFLFTSYNHVAEIGKFFNQKAILWIAAFSMTAGYLGVFSISLGVATLLMLFSVPVAQVLETFINNATPQHRNLLFSRFSRIQFTLLSIACLISSLVLPVIIPLAYGQEFATDFWVIFILLIGVLVGCQSNLLSSYFISINQLPVNVRSTYISVGSVILFGFILIPKMGIMGAAIAQSLAYVVQFGVQLYTLKVKLKLPNQLHLMNPSDVDFLKNQINLPFRKG